mmetsp:Transcript_32410/g.63341  ORF Transcript_32410/g.63341 Transcript_32410/m.63341 type:complete len:334 (+) Transcript_32410:425-1426(+)
MSYVSPLRGYNAEVFHCSPTLDLFCCDPPPFSWNSSSQLFKRFHQMCDTAFCWNRYYIQFPIVEGARLIEKNPAAMLWPHLALSYAKELMRCNSKITFTIRNPTDRLKSHFLFFKNGIHANMSFDGYVEALLTTLNTELVALEDAARKGEKETVDAWQDIMANDCNEERSIRFAEQFNTRGVHIRFVERLHSPLDRHERCGFLRGLLHGIYYPQLLTWVHALGEAGFDLRNRMRVVRAENLFKDPYAIVKKLEQWVGPPDTRFQCERKSTGTGTVSQCSSPNGDKTAFHIHDMSTRPGRNLNFKTRTRDLLNSFYAPWNTRLEHLLKELAIQL